MNLDRLIDRVGDWNPQLFRELRGRFGGNNYIFILAASGLIQLFICLWLGDGNPVDRGFQSLNWIIPISVMLGGIYSLVSDINQEEKQGTLNFIRLTPQSARSIFVGKLLGVPSLVYLAVLSIVPLHLCLAFASGASLGLILIWYLTIGITTYFFVNIAIFYALVGGKYGLLVSLVMLQPISAIVGLDNHYLDCAIRHESWLSGDSRELQWFYLPVINNIWLFYGFVSLTLLLASYWLWEKINRYYINSKSTSFSKEQSYWLNFSGQIWLLGFALPVITDTLVKPNLAGTFTMLAIFSGIGSLWTFCLISLILPSKRSMEDWIRYRQNLNQHHWWDRDIIEDLIWHDRSPSVLAMVINLAITAIIWGLCAILFVHDLELFVKLILGIAIATSLTLILTIIANLLGLVSDRTKAGGIGAVLLLFLLVPILGGLVLTSNPAFTSISANLFLFSPLFWVGVHKLSISQIFINILGQLGISVGLTKLFQRRLEKLVTSDRQNLIKPASHSERSKIMR